MAKITKIKAKESPSKKEADEPTITRKKVVIKDKKTSKAKRKDIKAAEKKITAEKSGKKPVLLCVWVVIFVIHGENFVK